MLKHTGMCYTNGLLFSPKILRHGSHFGQINPYKRDGLSVHYTLEINQLQICIFYVKMNHFEAHLSDGFIKSCRFQGAQDDRSVLVFFLIRWQNGQCNVKNFRQLLFSL